MVIRRFQDISFANEQDRDGVRFHNSSPIFNKLKRNRRSQFSPAFERRKCGGSYQGHSLLYGNERDARLFERCINDLGPEIFSFRKEEGDYNNPYISPRAGNCFCENPFCGNMNSRRGTCNSCDENRYSSSNGRMHGSPYPYGEVFLDSRNSHVDPSPSWRETYGYRSPPNCRARHQLRYPFIRHEGRRLPELEYHEDMGNRMDGKFYRPLTREGGNLIRDSWIQEQITRVYQQKRWSQHQRTIAEVYVMMCRFKVGSQGRLSAEGESFLYTSDIDGIVIFVDMSIAMMRHITYGTVFVLAFKNENSHLDDFTFGDPSYELHSLFSSFLKNNLVNGNQIIHANKKEVANIQQ